ncbi:glucose-repressible alcohol dehydrogenase transcriptional effector [Yamadazyma tenuis ATCC 10573]|uniref:CCR4-Not complex 3'-5'-exoribonuclease subunit Ccr4 n=2 Tax=Candida tenuis TaxID=2315449 RepID=G3AW81_CANTC|nr:glucose-repressible alcohol dehydrogenase transcriptional effector [Yamadazyma tenuis ATCC 10573]EGV66477.1 glucose-repressible alcohol dehydrogenase transcriptional effector [Yamadazyma tenuis ATCC 10573]
MQQMQQFQQSQPQQQFGSYQQLPPHLQQSQPQTQGQNSQQYGGIQGPKQSSIAVDKPNSIHWQHQQQLCQISRSASIPHYYARQYAANSRKVKNPYNDVKSVSLIDATKSIVASVEEQERLSQKSSTPTTNAALLYNKKTVNYYEDDTMHEEERMRQKTNGQQLWCQLDLSGQGISNVSPKLFNYDFLESLYLNNNKLTAVPSMISRLRGLRTLDLSQNKIEDIPGDLGLCYNLRYLYLFDNEIKTLPNGLGNLIELLFLGIEGNPMDPQIANILAEKGTKDLITYLRDLPPTLPKPKARDWILLEDDGEVIDPTANPEAYANEDSNSSSSFTLMSYNTLCQHYATTRMHKYTPAWALDWEYRRPLLEKEVTEMNTDVVCMQEVETRTFHEFWVPRMQKLGYKGLFYSKTRSKTMGELDAKKVDGCAVFYKTSKFELIQKINFEYNSACMGSEKYKKTKDLFNRFMNKDHVALIAFMQHKETGEKICIITTHLHWDPLFNDVKALQVGVLLEELKGILKKFVGANDDVKNTPLIICGDFNSIVDSAVYQLFSTGSVKTHSDLDGYDYGKFTEEGFKNVFKLKSAYETVGELPFTNCTPDFTTTIDYIWYTPGSIEVKGLLGKVDPDYAKHVIGFPDANFPSDHIPLVSKFQIKKNGGHKRADFKPDFRPGSSRKT